MPDYSEYLSPEILPAIRSGEPTDIIEIRTGSDSDFPKIKEVINSFKEKNVPYILRILSAHRTPQNMMETAQAFPKVLLPKNIQEVIDVSNLRVKFCIACAGGSAHIAGMTASETQTPIIALPVPSSSMGLIDATLSMMNMPPGVPNGFVPNNEIAIMVAHGLYNLSLPSDTDTIRFWGGEYEKLSDADRELMSQLGLKCDQENSNINIVEDELFSPLTPGRLKTDFNVIIPTMPKRTPIDEVVEKFQREKVNGTGAYMGIQTIEEGQSLKYTNAILYAAQIIGIFNPTVRKNLEVYRHTLSQKVEQNEVSLLNQQFFFSV